MAAKVVHRTVLVPEELDVELKVLAARVRVDKSDLYELGARIVLALAREARIPAELGAILRRRDPHAMEILSKIILAARG